MADLVLRVHGGDQDGKIVRLPPGKSTLGSDDACTLRFCDEGIQPVHCLLLHGRGGTIVRSWAEATWLNNCQFSDAQLAAGDRLRVAFIEFEVIGDEDNRHRASMNEPEVADDRSAADVGQPDVTATTESPESAWLDMLGQLRGELETLAGERQAWSDERARWQSEVARYEGELANLQTRFEQFQQERHSERESWLDQLHQLQTLLAAETQSQERATFDDAVTGDEGTGGATHYYEDPFPLQGDSVASVERIEDEAADRHESEYRSWQDADTPWAGIPASGHEPSEASPPVADKNDQSFDYSSGEPADRPIDADVTPVPEGYESSEASPPVADDSKQSFGYLPGEPADCPIDADVQPQLEGHERSDSSQSTEPPAPTETPEWLQQYQEQGDDADDSISDYMARLLGRVSGDAEPASFTETQPSPSQPSVHDVAPAGGEGFVPAVEESPRTVPDKPIAIEPEATSPASLPLGYAPRRLAPERDGNIQAMRELANVSARSAIRTFDNSCTAKEALHRIPLLLVELLGGGCLLYMALISQQILLCAAAALAFAAAGVTGLKALGLLFKVTWTSITKPRLKDRAGHR